MTTETCTSCGMQIESGPYCQHCADTSGALLGFDEVFERMRQWARRQDPGLSDAEVDQSTLAYMRKMPAWADHPRVKTAAPS